MSKFHALPGIYQAVFLYFEPISTFIPILLLFFVHDGPASFHHQLIPSDAPPSGSLDVRTNLAIWQLTNCYVLLGLISSFVFRAARDALPDNSIAQERIVGSLLCALAIADVTHVFITFATLPSDLVYNPVAWNAMTHGNTTIVVVLFLFRIAWFLGLGRKGYYYGLRAQEKDNKMS